jgi:iron complex transport system permease protein
MNTAEDMVREYHRYIRRKVIFIALCVLVSFIALGLSLSIGGRSIGFFEVYGTVFDHIMGVTHEYLSSEWMDDYIIWNIRLPRSLFAIVTGVSLAIAGAIMQSVMVNPLADPYTTGISSGACFGVAVSSVFGFSVMNGALNGGSLVNAFVFSLVPMILMIVIMPRLRASAASLILVGVAVSYLFNSLSTVVLTFTDSETLATVFKWQVGTLENITWDSLLLPVVVTIFGSVLVSLMSRKLNVLALGDKEATALGISADTMRILMMCVVSLMIASVVAYAGIIGFIGLVCPHIVRMLIGSDNRFVIPGGAMFGATFFLLCDMLARYISPLGDIPVGVVVSFVGAPIFLFLIMRESRSIW